LSDGARIDIFRRANAGLVSTEQVVTAPRFNSEKWKDLLQNLRKDLHDAEARFAFVFLIDDFSGSATTLLRKKDNEWQGKLPRFWGDVQDVLETHFEPDWTLCVHHHLATHQAKETILERQSQALSELPPGKWFSKVKFSYGAILPDDLRLDEARHAGFL